MIIRRSLTAQASQKVPELLLGGRMLPQGVCVEHSFGLVLFVCHIYIGSFNFQGRFLFPHISTFIDFRKELFRPSFSKCLLASFDFCEHLFKYLALIIHFLIKKILKKPGFYDL